MNVDMERKMEKGKEIEEGAGKRRERESGKEEKGKVERKRKEKKNGR